MSNQLLGAIGAPSWESLVSSGSEARKDYRFEESEKLLQAALKQAEKFGDQDPRLTATLRELADTFYIRRKYVQAERLYRRELDILKALGENYPDVVHDLMGLGRIYKERGKYSEAQRFFEEALAHKQKTDTLNDGEELVSLWELARIYAYQRKYTQGAAYFEKALALRKIVMPHLPELPNELIETGDNYRNELNFEKAQNMYKRAIVVSEKQGEVAEQDLAIGLTHLAKNQMDWGKKTEADEATRRLMVFAKEWPARHKPAIWLTTLGNSLASLGKYAEAKSLYEKALATKGDSALSPEHTVMTLSNLGDSYYRQKNFSEAARRYQKALDLYKKLNKSPSIELACYLRQVGNAHLAQLDLSHAEPFIIQALAIDEKFAEPNSVELGRSYASTALLYYDQRKYDQAIPLYKKALAIYQMEDPETANSTSVAGMAAHLASAYCKKKDYAKAEPLYKLSIGLFAKSEGDVAQYSKACRDYENMLRSTNRVAQANEIAAEAKSKSTNQRQGQ